MILSLGDIPENVLFSLGEFLKIRMAVADVAVPVAGKAAFIVFGAVTGAAAGPSLLKGERTRDTP